ncbi:MAG: 16S rRNA (uracil(1498)-N(3))-methyltransferase [Clostridiales Family XIII bacterium]|jgi:16S rRNA (uracil1498-N3)-methyltransferase|nr:16S rRNA (uracil(1498)-N(3))-methyltransferase [Clostridiales Family XIII bacterium]
MRRFFVPKDAILGDRILILDRQDIHHMLDVLRMRAGDRLLISDRSETEYEAEIVDASKTGVTLKALASRAFAAEARYRATLYQGIPKGQKMDLVVQKSIELGAGRIVPLVTARVVPEAPGKKLERWRRIAAETVKQCQRGDVPVVEGPMTVAQAAAEIAGGAYGRALVLYELEESVTLKEALAALPPQGGADAGAAGKPPALAIVVGPEGGLERSEVEAFTAAGAASVTVGSAILRTETAGPAALAMLLYQYGL